MVTTLDYLARLTVPTAFALLPEVMNSRPAAAMLLAIALQESAATHRRQLSGPARGFWQFEVNGVIGVRQHQATAEHVRTVLTTLSYAPTATSRTIQASLEHNDVLACAFARLLLWTVPAPLPERHAPDAGWRQYLGAWRPGRPHRELWDGCFAHAWDVVGDPT